MKKVSISKGPYFKHSEKLEKSQPSVSNLFGASCKYMDELSKAFQGFRQMVNENRQEDLQREQDAVKQCLIQHKDVKMVR